MHDIAIVLSIISSILVIIYLLGLIFGNRKKDDVVTITISGRIVTKTVTEYVQGEPIVSGSKHGDGQEGRVVEGEVVDAKTLQEQVRGILQNVK